MSYHSCLLKVPLFSDLDQKDLQEISDIIEPHEYRKNETIIYDGEAISSLYVIHQGQVKITKTSLEGVEAVSGLLKSGDYFGEKSLLEKVISDYEVVALEKCHICVIDQNQFQKILSTNLALSLNIIESLLEKIDRLENHYTSQELKPAHERVFNALIDRSSHNRVELKLSKKDLAASLGMSPETFSRSLKKLEQMNLINVRDSKVIDLVHNNSF